MQPNKQNKNTIYDSEKHHRRSIRLKEYDYTLPGAYFVTICTEKRKCLFGEISNDTMQLNKSGTIIHTCWNNIPKHFVHARLDAYIIMPNHIHGIIIITERDCNNNANGRGEAFSTSNELRQNFVTENASPLHPHLMNQPHGTFSGSLGAIMQNFKSVSTRKINQSNNTPGVTLWQRNYYEHIIRNENSLNIIRRYIMYNPLMWAYDMDNPERYHVSEAELKHVLKKRCNFTNEELDFISSAWLRTGIKCDIKYHVGQDYGDNKQ